MAIAWSPAPSSILTLVLMAWAWRASRGDGSANWSFTAFGLIIVQAVLGGITVLFVLPLADRGYACGDRASVLLPDGIARDFHQSAWDIDARSVDEPATRIPLATLALINDRVIYLQILIGALMRHMGAGLGDSRFSAVVRTGSCRRYWNESIAINFAHRCGAIVVTALVLWTVARVLADHRDDSRAAAPGARAVLPAGHSDLSGRDDYLEWPRGVADHRACCDWRRGAGDQPDPNDSRAQILGVPHRIGSDRARREHR